ncbi:MAG: glycosyltransferase family 4 protein [Clostridia bacterium]|nr:glycosyltransferase family 4 protein [Clostridia bacterium]
MTKKILVMGDYFYPDVQSTGQILTELCTELQNDFSITVLTSVPSSNTDQYSEAINYENYQNLRLVRIKTKPFDKRSKFSRIKHIVEYFFLVRQAIRKLEKQDIVLAISQPPILGGLQGIYAKKIHKAKFIYNIHDFNPEQAEAVGYFKFSFIYKILKMIDTSTCKKADKIVIVGSDMKETLRRRGIEEDSKIFLINNWIDEECVYPLADEKVEEFKVKYRIDNKLIIMYSGNIGLYYDLENIIKVLGKFKHREDIVFAFVGDGAKREELELWVKTNCINNIRFIPYQKKEEIIYSLNAADVHIVANKKGIKGVSVPSKIYGVMASGKYILGILEGGSEAASLIENSSCGCIIEPGDYSRLHSTIEAIIDTDKVSLAMSGIRGRKYLETYLRKGQAIEKYLSLFKSL